MFICYAFHKYANSILLLVPNTSCVMFIRPFTTFPVKAHTWTEYAQVYIENCFLCTGEVLRQSGYESHGEKCKKKLLEQEITNTV